MTPARLPFRYRMFGRVAPWGIRTNAGGKPKVLRIRTMPRRVMGPIASAIGVEYKSLNHVLQ